MVASICKDGEGVFMGFSALDIPGISDPATLEAIACREALALAIDLYAQRVFIASDCLHVINLISKPSKCSFLSVISEINQRQTQFEKIQYVHEKSSSDTCAHNLARNYLYLE
uniref:Uncharacterized protein n=1 Tax=Avena sativa TaxID=4498 RepID=A0ACD6A090_AVESA